MWPLFDCFDESPIVSFGDLCCFAYNIAVPIVILGFIAAVIFLIVHWRRGNK